MKLVTYATTTGSRVGILSGDGVRDGGFEGSMLELIEAGPGGLHKLRRAAASSRPIPGARLLAPIQPRSLRDFLTFERHLKGVMERLGREVADEWYRVPAYYKGLPDTVIGPEEEVPWPAYTDQLDHELELAAIIGKTGKNISRDAAPGHIFGWTIWNDVSARDTQAMELPLSMGPGKAKDWDGSNVLGPCIVTADELDGQQAHMSVRVNGELWGEANSSEMHHKFADLIAYASQSQTLHPGEVFGSGTAPGGSGIELGRWLAPGDTVEMEVR